MQKQTLNFLNPLSDHAKSKYRSQSLVFFSLCWLILTPVIASAQNFKLQVGDLLFQDLDCGVLCNGIGQVTYGVNNTYMSHVGMVENINKNQATIIEAIGSGVVETPLNAFMSRSYDKNHHPMVMVGRIKPPYKHLIPEAVSYAEAQLGKPYNGGFAPNNGQSFYCSQLIYAAFSSANHNKSIFGLNIMNFNDPHTHKMTLAWKEYFAKLNIAAPQGKSGTNPGMMSRESSITIVYAYGELRRHR